MLKSFVKKLKVNGKNSLKLVLSATSSLNPQPIFILGNQKSGTTVIASLLAELTGLSATIDLPGLYEPVQTNLHAQKISFLQFILKNKLDFSRAIIKEPCLTFLYQDLVNFFPNSKMILVVRDPRDNIRSILNRLSIPGNLINLKQQQLQNISPEWRLLLNGDWLGLKGENYIEMLAERWNLSSDVYLCNFDNIILIRYEDFIKDKTGEIYKLSQQIGLKPINDITDRVNIQYQPAGNKNISWLNCFGQNNLERIESLCSKRMKQFGYLISN
jgi:Sulfotransferase domain